MDKKTKRLTPAEKFTGASNSAEAVRSAVLEDALEELGNAYQRGEITGDEFVQKRKELDAKQDSVVGSSAKSALYVESLMNMFSRVNTVFAGRQILCQADTSNRAGEMIACTDGTNIYFGARKIAEWFKVLEASSYNPNAYGSALRLLADFRGLNYHELSHVMFTPKGSTMDSEIFNWVAGVRKNFLFNLGGKARLAVSVNGHVIPPDIHKSELKAYDDGFRTNQQTLVGSHYADRIETVTHTQARCVGDTVAMALFDRWCRKEFPKVFNGEYNPATTDFINELSAAKTAFFIHPDERLVTTGGVVQYPHYVTTGSSAKYHRPSQQNADVFGYATPVAVADIDTAIYEYEKYCDAIAKHNKPALVGIHLPAHELAYHIQMGSNESIMYSMSPDYEKFRRVWNLLEDHRIESLMVAKYPQTRHYFRSAVARNLITELNKIGNNKMGMDEAMKEKVVGQLWLFLYGRRFLDADLRHKAKDVFQKTFGATDSQMKELQEIMDWYRHAPMYGNIKQWLRSNAPRIANKFLRFYEIIALELGVPFFGSHSPTGSGHHGEQRTGGSTVGKKEGEELLGDLQKDDEEADKEEQGRSGAGSDESDTEPSDDDAGTEKASPPSPEQGEESGEAPTSDSGDSGSDDSSDSTDGEGGRSESSADGTSEDTEGIEDLENEHDGTESVGRGVSIHGKTKFKDAVVDSALDKFNAGIGSLLHDLAESREEAQQHLLESQKEMIANVAKQVDVARMQNLFKNKAQSGHEIEPEASWKMFSASLANALRTLQSYRENDWLHDSAVGKPDILKWQASRGLHTEFFDEWVDDGDERPDCEVVILLDSSGSMHHLMADACSAMWAVKKACQNSDIPCSVFIYDTEFKPVFAPYDKIGNAVPVYSTGGSTDPESLVRVAATHLQRSDAKHRIMISITDGQWGTGWKETAYSRILKGIGAQGVETILIQLPERVEEMYVYDPDTNARTVQRVAKYSVLPANKYGHGQYIKAERPDVMAKQIAKVIVKGVKNH